MIDPTTYEYTLPEGYELKPETRIKLDALVTETSLTNEQMQKFLDLHVELMEEFAEAFAEANTQNVLSTRLYSISSDGN